MIRGQYMQVLLDKMKNYTDQDSTSESYDPITLLKRIERKILAQTKDQYLYTKMYYQECALQGFQQHKMTNKQYYEYFNTKVDGVESISITRQHHFLTEDTTQQKLKIKLDEISTYEQP